MLPRKIENTVELKTRRTANSKEFMHPDGSLSIELSASPLHFKSKTGVWQDFDNTLVESPLPGFAYVNKSNFYHIHFAADNKNGPLVRLSLDDDHYIHLSPSVRFDATGTIADNCIEYKKIQPGVALRYAVCSGKVKEEIVIGRHPENSEFTFDIECHNIHYEISDDGIVYFKKPDSKTPSFSFEKLYAADSRGDESTGIHTSIKSDGNRLENTIAFDKTWLDSAAYPVVIDPTIDIIDFAASDTYISSANVSPSTRLYWTRFQARMVRAGGLLILPTRYANGTRSSRACTAALRITECY